jgi:ribonuclease HI
MDSNLVINQLSGVWKIKKDELKVLYEDVKKLIFEKNVIVNFKWIPRELNAEADRLSNVAMDQ